MPFEFTDLAPFQQEGVKFLTDLDTYPNPNRILFDEMGLGKTPQASYALKVVEAKRILIVTLANPKVLKQWKEHLVSWTGISPHQIQVVKSTEERIRKPVVIVNFEKITARRRVYRQLIDLDFDALVIDECHKLKNIDSMITRLMYVGSKHFNRRAIIDGAKRVWLLTGTILPNRAFELYPHASALFPDLLGKYVDPDRFIEHFCGFMGLETRNSEELFQLMKPAMLRREKKDVLTDLLPIKADMHYIEGIEMDTTGMQVPTVRRELAILKAPYVVEFLKKEKEAEEGMITVFTWHQAMTEYLSANLPKCATIYGKTPKKRIDTIMNRVLRGQVPYLILQLSSGGTGLDGIQHISKRMVLAEPDWVPGNIAQMIGRLHRWGQKMEVYLTILCARNTIDEYVDWKQRTKSEDIGQFNSRVTSNKVSFKQFKERLKTMADRELERIADALEVIVEHLTGGEKPEPKTSKKTTKKADKEVEKKTEDKAEEAKAEKDEEKKEEKPAAKKQEKEPEGRDEITIDQLRETFIKVAAKHGREAIVAVFEQLGITSISDAPEDKYQEILAALQELGA